MKVKAKVVTNGKRQLQFVTVKKPSVLVRERETARDGTRIDRRKDGTIKKKTEKGRKLVVCASSPTGVL